MLRIVEANTQSLVRILDMLKAVLSTAVSRGYRLSEYEAKCFLPGLVEKSGHNQDRIKADHRELMALAAAVYGAPRVLPYLRDGLESKNNKTRCVCAEEIGATVDREGAAVYAAAGCRDVLPAVAKLVSERDGSLRSAALCALEVVYCFEGECYYGLTRCLTD